MDGEFTAEALQKLTQNYEDSDDEVPIPVVKRLSLSDDGESSVDINKILSNYTSSPPVQNNKNDAENNSNTTTKKTRKRTPSVTKDSNNRITNYIKSNTNKTTAKSAAKSTAKSKKSKLPSTGMRYGIDDLLAENERYKSHQNAKHHALSELRRIDDESASSDSDVEMQVHNVLLEKGGEKDGDIEERRQALKSHQKIQKLIAVSQEATETERKDQLFTKNWKKRVVELTPLPIEDKDLAPDCILFTGTVPPFEKLLSGSLKYLVDREPFLKSIQFITWLLQICCHSDVSELVWAAHETLVKILDSNPNCKIFTFQLIVDLLNDFGADLSIIGHLESNEDEMEIDVVSTDWDWSTRFPLFNLQIVLEVLSGSILKDLCDLTREEKYSLLGICYNMTLDIKAFKLLPELQRVMEALYISLDAHRQLVIADIIHSLKVDNHDYKILAQCVNMTPYGTKLTRFVRQNLAASLLESAAETSGIQYTKMGNAEMININNLIKHLKTIKVDQASTDCNELFCVMKLVEFMISVHYDQFAKHVDLFMKLHTTLLSISSQIKDTSGLFHVGTQLKEFVVYLCSKIILMKNGYAKQQGRQSFMQEYLDS